MATDFERAVSIHQRGDLATAAEMYRQLLTANPRHAGAWHMLGVVEHQSGNPAQALVFIERAIRLNFKQSIFFNNYGAALQALGRWIESLGCFQRAVALQPKYADAHSNLGLALDELGNYAGAEKRFRAALELAPKHADSHWRLGRLLVRAGRRREAQEHLEQARAVHPQNVDLLGELASCCLIDGRPQDALPYLRQVVELDPRNGVAFYNLATALAAIDMLPEATVNWERACSLAPAQRSWKLWPLTVSPKVFPNASAVDDYRRTLDVKLDQTLSNSAAIDGEELFRVGFCPPFSLAFQGRNDRPIKEKFASIVRRGLPSARRPTRSNRRIPRVGIVVTRGHEAMFLRSMGEITAQFDPQRLEALVLCPRSSERRLKRGFANSNVRIVTFDEDLLAASDVIRSAECDLMHYWEVGTDPLNYLLPFCRLAPLQSTSWGTQVTSGIAEIDYYLSSSLIETEGSDDHYTEQLCRLPGLLSCQKRIPPPPATRKKYFGFDEHRPVYLCPQTVLKLHPEQDSLFAAVLRKDPHGILVVKLGQHDLPNQTLQKRLAASIPDALERIHFMPWQTREDYYRLVSVADVVLDTIYFSAGSSSYDMWSLNVPVVAYPGNRNIARYTLACYKKMGNVDYVAHTPEQYAELAVRLANDPKSSEEARRFLREQTPLLFDDRQAVRDHENAFVEWVENRLE